MEFCINKRTNSIGTHFIADLYKIPKTIFSNDLCKENYDTFDTLVELSLNNNNMNIVKKDVFFFDNYNGAFTSVYLLSESHLSIHTWPEKEYIALDVFTCGYGDTQKIVNELISILKPETYKIQKIERGILL